MHDTKKIKREVKNTMRSKTVRIIALVTVIIFFVTSVGMIILSAFWKG